YQPFLRDRDHSSVQAIEQLTVDPRGGVDETRGIDEVARTVLVHDDCCFWKGRGKIAIATGVVEVDMRNDDPAQIVGVQSERCQRPLNGGNRTLRPRLYQCRLR